MDDKTLSITARLDTIFLGLSGLSTLASTQAIFRSIYFLIIVVSIMMVRNSLEDIKASLQTANLLTCHQLVGCRAEGEVLIFLKKGEK